MMKLIMINNFLKGYEILPKLKITMLVLITTFNNHMEGQIPSMGY